MRTALSVPLLNLHWKASVSEYLTSVSCKIVGHAHQLHANLLSWHLQGKYQGAASQTVSAAIRFAPILRMYSNCCNPINAAACGKTW